MGVAATTAAVWPVAAAMEPVAWPVAAAMGPVAGPVAAGMVEHGAASGVSESGAVQVSHQVGHHGLSTGNALNGF